MAAGQGNRRRDRRKADQRSAASTYHELFLPRTRFHAGDPEPWRAALAQLHLAPDDLLATARPWSPPHEEAAEWSLDVMHSGTDQAVGQYFLVCTVPDGLPMPERGIAYPEGCFVDDDDGEMLHLTLPHTVSPLLAAHSLARFLDAVMGAEVGHWFSAEVGAP